MKFKITLIISLVALAAICFYFAMSYKPEKKAIEFEVTDGGSRISSLAANITNCRFNNTVSVLYHIKNKSSSDISPVFFKNILVNPDDYSGAAGYNSANMTFADYITIKNITGKNSDMKEVIKPGDEGIYELDLNIPEKAVSDNVAFKIGVSGNNGGFTCLAWETWYCVSMR